MSEKRSFRKGTKVRCIDAGDPRNGKEGKVIGGFYKEVYDPKAKARVNNEWVLVQHDGEPDYRKHGYLASSLEKASK